MLLADLNIYHLYVLHPVVCPSKKYIYTRQHNNSGKSNNKSYLH
jgi:hypothetical protein